MDLHIHDDKQKASRQGINNNIKGSKEDTKSTTNREVESRFS